MIDESIKKTEYSSTYGTIVVKHRMDGANSAYGSRPRLSTCLSFVCA